MAKVRSIAIVLQNAGPFCLDLPHLARMPGKTAGKSIAILTAILTQDQPRQNSRQ